MPPEKKLNRLIFRPEIRSAKNELAKHYSEIGKRFVFLDKNNFPEGNIYIIERVVKNIRKPYESAHPRSHTVDAVMIFTGFQKTLGGMHVEITLENKKYKLETPFVVFLPKNTEHTYKIIKGSGWETSRG